MAKDELFSLQNVGKATFKDLKILGINNISKLAKANADKLYTTLTCAERPA